MLGQPGFQSSLARHILLQTTQGQMTCFQTGHILPALQGLLLRLLALLFQSRKLGLQMLHMFLSLLQLILQHVQIALQALQIVRVRGIEFAQFLLQALLTLLHTLDLTVGITLRLRSQGQILFQTRQSHAHFVPTLGLFAYTQLQIGQGALRLLQQNL